MAQAKAKVTDIPEVIGKADIARSFGNAAPTYDSVAALQRQVGQRLLSLAPERQCRQTLDLGCGTGFFLPHLNHRMAGGERMTGGETVAGGERVAGGDCVAMDLSAGMVEFARNHQGREAAGWVVGDAEQLPFRSDWFDFVFSSLTVQWCRDLGQVLGEVRRLLAPGGVFAFSTLVDGTLYELDQAWRAVDDYTHVNDFQTEETLRKTILASGYSRVDCHCEPQVRTYDRLSELTGELKMLGANNRNHGRPGGLTTPVRLRRLKAAYESFRNDQGKLPATYQVFYAILTR